MNIIFYKSKEGFNEARARVCKNIDEVAKEIRGVELSDSLIVEGDIFKNPLNDARYFIYGGITHVLDLTGGVEDYIKTLNNKERKH